MKNDYLAVLRLVQDADTSLEAAIDEVKLREIKGWGVVLGAVGAAQNAVKFTIKLIQAASSVDRDPA